MLEHFLQLYGASEDTLVAAAENSKVDVLVALLSRGVNVNGKESHFGRTALHAAADMGSKKTATFLLHHGADPNALDRNSMTPLMCACAKGKKKGSEVALLILEHGANATYVRSDDGMTAYKFALFGACTPEALSALVKAGAQLPEPGFQVIRFV